MAAMSTRSQRAVVLVALIAFAAGAGVWTWRAQPAPPVAAPADRSVLRLEVVPGEPRAARLVLDGEVLGGLARDAQGNMSGDSLIKLPLRSRRLGTRPVDIVRDPAIDPELALAAQRVLHHGGARNAVVVDQ